MRFVQQTRKVLFFYLLLFVLVEEFFFGSFKHTFTNISVLIFLMGSGAIKSFGRSFFVVLFIQATLFLYEILKYMCSHAIKRKSGEQAEQRKIHHEKLWLSHNCLRFGLENWWDYEIVKIFIQYVQCAT